MLEVIQVFFQISEWKFYKSKVGKMDTLADEQLSVVKFWTLTK